MANRVNVLLHGIFGYVFTPSHIEAYSPAVCGHIYKVSRSTDLHDAKPLPRSDYALSGVNQGKPFSPDPKVSPVIKLKKKARIDEFSKRYCKILLPYPTTFRQQGTPMWALDSYKVGAIFRGRDARHLNAVQPFPSMHAFCYERNDDFLELSDAKGGKSIRFNAPRKGAADQISNLHIWCTTPPMDMSHHVYTPEGHLRRGFAALVDLFPNLEVSIEIPDGFTPAAGPEPYPKGVGRCDVDPGRDGCSHFGHVNCYYANILAV